MIKKNKYDYSSYIPSYLQKSDKFYAVITDMIGSYAYVNDLFKKKFAFVADDFVGLPLSVAMHEDDNSQCNEAVEKLLKAPDSIVAVRVRKPSDINGGFFWSDWEFSIVKNEQGEPIGVLCVGVDSSEKELLEHDKGKIALAFDGLVQTMKDPFFSLDRNWKYSKVNAKLLDLLKCSDEDLLGKSYWSHSIDTDSNTLSENLLKAMNEQEVLNMDLYLTSNEMHINLVAHPSLGGLNVYLFDITEERKRTEELENQRVQLEKLLVENNAFMEIINQVAIVSKADLKGNITFVNEQFMKWSGYLEKELLGQNHRILKSEKHDDSFFNDLWRTISRGNVYRNEIMNKAKDGSIYWVDTIITPVFDKNKMLKEYVAIRFVINERKKAEELLLSNNNSLREIAWLQSHELRKPLANIKGLVELIQMGAKEKVNEELIAGLIQSTEELDQVIHKITEKTQDK